MLRSFVYSCATWFLFTSFDASAQSFLALPPHPIPDGSGISTHFGGALSVSGPTIVVGSITDCCEPYFDNGATEGAVFVYRHSNGTWIHQTTLSAPAANLYNAFGASVSVSGDFLVVGAPSQGETGKAYVFRYNGVSWGSARELNPSDPTGLYQYGARVAVVGDVAVVGTVSSESGGESRQFVFRFNGEDWIEEAVLESGITEAEFAVMEDMILLKEYEAVSVFRHEGGEWVDAGTLTSPANASGGHVAAAGNVAVVSFREGPQLRAAARVYRYNGAAWQEEAVLTDMLIDDWESSHPARYTYATDGDRILIGSPWFYQEGVASGKVYFYERGESGWVLKATYMGIEPDFNVGDFGIAVAVSGEVATVGAFAAAFVLGSPVSTDADAPDTLPRRFHLFQNYPNPFNPSTTIRFDLASTSRVVLTVHDTMGRLVRTLVDGELGAGNHVVVFDSQGLPSGAYAYRLKTDGDRMFHQMILTK